MPWLIIATGYLLGSIPTAYIAARALRGSDIRRIGDGNVGAANAFRELGRPIGIAIGIIDAAKGALAVLIARAVSPEPAVSLAAGAAAVIGHNWPVLLGFRGGRGVSTTIGVLITVVTLPVLLLAVPALLVLLWKKNVSFAAAVLFVPLAPLGWWLGIQGPLIVYSVALPCLVGFTHLLRTAPGMLRST